MDLNVKITTPASNIPARTTDAASTRLWRHTPASVSNLTLGIPVSFSTAAQLVRQEDVSAFAIEICFSFTLYRLWACNSSFSGPIEFLQEILFQYHGHNRPSFGSSSLFSMEASVTKWIVKYSNFPIITWRWQCWQIWYFCVYFLVLNLTFSR